MGDRGKRLSSCPKSEMTVGNSALRIRIVFGINVGEKRPDFGGKRDGRELMDMYTYWVLTIVLSTLSQA